MSNLKRRRDGDIDKDNRKYDDLVNKQHTNDDLTYMRKKYDQHRNKFQSLYRNRKYTDVLETDCNYKDVKREQNLSELNEFDYVARVEDFKKFDPQTSKYICKVDATQKMKFKTSQEFDNFFSKDRASSLIDSFNLFYHKNKKINDSKKSSRSLKKQDIYIQDGNLCKMVNTESTNNIEQKKLEEQLTESQKAKIRVYKDKIVSNYKKNIPTKRKVKQEERIQMQILWIRGYKYKDISKLVKQSANTVGTSIHRLRQDKLTNSLTPYHIARRKIDHSTLNSLFKYLDNYQGNDPMYKVTQRYLKSNYNLEVKKSYVYSLLKQGNFTRVIGNKCSKDEIFNKEKQRHYLFNLQMMSILQPKSQNVQVLDEFGVQCNSSTKHVIVRKGKIKDKQFKNQDIKVNVAITMCEDGIFTFQFGSQGFMSTIFEYYYHYTLDNIVDANKNNSKAFLIMDNNTPHEYLPLYKWIDIKGESSTCKVLTFFNSGQFSKISPVERLIGIIKSRLKFEKFNNQEECKKSITKILKKINKEDIKSVYRRSAFEWKQYLKIIYKRVYGNDFQ